MGFLHHQPCWWVSEWEQMARELGEVVSGWIHKGVAPPNPPPSSPLLPVLPLHPLHPFNTSFLLPSSTTMSSMSSSDSDGSFALPVRPASLSHLLPPVGRRLIVDSSDSDSSASSASAAPPPPPPPQGPLATETHGCGTIAGPGSRRAKPRARFGRCAASSSTGGGGS